MGLQETLKRVHECLENAGIEHALIGGLGLASLGIHRATFDIDFLIDGKKKDLTRKTLTSNGWKVAMETEEVLHFTGIGRVDFLLANRPMSLELLASAKPGGLQIRCVSAEGIIGLKIQAYKNDPEREGQDKVDIQSLIKKYPQLDWEQVKKFADLFGEWETISRMRSRK